MVRKQREIKKKTQKQKQIHLCNNTKFTMKIIALNSANSKISTCSV